MARTLFCHSGVWLAAALLVAPMAARAALPVRHTLAGAQELDKGELTNLSLSDTGRLRLAPRVDELGTFPKEIVVWSLARGPDGTLYAGTGHNGLVMRAPPGKPFEPMAQTGDMLVTALAVDAAGMLYAGTSPRGRIVKVSQGSVATVLQTDQRYVWALAVGKDGALVAGLGPKAQVVSVVPGAAGRTLYTGTQRHVGAIAVAPDGTIYAGTEPDGLVIAIAPGAKPRVLFAAPQPEIRGLALAPDGVFALATTAKRGGGMGADIGVGGPPVGHGLPSMPPATHGEPHSAPGPRPPGSEMGAMPNPVQAAPTHAGQDRTSGGGAPSSPQAAGPPAPVAPVAPAGAPAAGAEPSSRSDSPIAPAGPSGPGSGSSPGTGSGVSPAEAPGAPPDAPASAASGAAPAEAASSAASVPETPAKLNGPPGAPGASPGPPILTPPPLPPGAPPLPGPPSRPTPPARFGRVGPDGEPAVYHVTRDGLATQVLAASESVLLCIAADGAGRVYVGSGHEGIVYRVDGDRVDRLVKLPDAQVMSLVVDGDRVVAGTGNPARVVAFGAASAGEGTYVSEAMALGTQSSVGRVDARGELPDGTGLQAWVRTGASPHPDETWSQWGEVGHPLNGGQADVAPGRWFQLKLKLTSGKLPASPQIREASVIVQSINLPPRVTSVDVGMPVVELTSEPRDPADREAAKAHEKKKYEPTPIRHVKWEATDPNDDRLVYRLSYRAVGDKDWRPVNGRDMWAGTLDWDTSDLADGYYEVRVTASDAPSNPAGGALTAERVSEPFLVDNNPPDFKDLTVDVQPDRTVKVTGKVHDEASNIANIEAALDAEDFRMVRPDDGMADSPAESFSVTLGPLSSGVHAITLKVYDDLGNVRTERRTVTAP